MNEALKAESEKLARSWMQHEAGWLRDYLVAGVEDPRCNIQSILSRHFIVRSLFRNQFEELLEQEIRFGAVMNWLRDVLGKSDDEDVPAGILHALQSGADNFEGLPVPHFVLQTFRRLSSTSGPHLVPNYIWSFLSDYRESVLDTFQNLWAEALRTAAQTSALSSQSPSLLEPACGSANDYRFLQSYGLGNLLDYTGFDLCPKNIANAQTLFPRTRFAVGNVFEIDAPDRSFDLCVLHDLFEHLSLEGLEVAVREVCRVTHRSLCVGFFQMDEISDHIVRPLDEYYWNLLSVGRMKTSFARQGFTAQVIHISTFLRQQIGCDYTHNPNAYTFLLDRVG